MQKGFKKGAIYSTNSEYGYVLSVHSGKYYVSDCFPCDEQGNILEGYESPMPVRLEDLTEMVGFVCNN